MSKKNVIIDSITASSTQAITIATVTNPTTSVLCVTAVAIIAGLTKEFLLLRNKDISGIASELIKPDTVKAIKQMDEDRFADDLYYSIDKILKQRTEPKRVLMRNVFLGYLKTNHKSSYPLEKMYSVIENLTFADVALFRKVLDADSLRSKSNLPWVAEDIMKSHSTPEADQKKMMILTYTKDSQDQQSISNLVDAGILIRATKGLGMWSAGEGTPQIYITQFGLYFKDYLLGVKDL